MKIATVVGARPQFIKAAAVTRALRRTSSMVQVLIHTGQHYDENMSDVFLRELGLQPDYNLGAGSGRPGKQTARMIEAIEQTLLEVQPDFVLVYGDTNSTLAGAIAAVKLQMRVGHVEAGLRCFDLHMPEEVNRVLTDHSSDLLFAPTAIAVDNLLREGIARSKIFQTGDVMYDAFLQSASREANDDVLCKLQIDDQGYVLATIHRAENTDDSQRLKVIIDGLIEVAAELPVILPLHPRTREALRGSQISLQFAKGLRVIDPVSYSEMTTLERHARAIATDSGGVQKEAFFHQVPCVILRERTEWEELVGLGWSFLVEPDSQEKVATTIRKAIRFSPLPCVNPYGDGHSSEKIVEVLLNHASRA